MTTARLGEKTRADLDAMPDDGQRYELIDGVIVNAPAPTPRHQDVVFGLMKQLDAACPDNLRVLASPGVRLGERLVPQPDVVVVRPYQLTDKVIEGIPALAVEVLSPSNRYFDLVEKKGAYERAAIPSYWIVDPGPLTMTVWELIDGHYAEIVTISAGEAWSATLPFEVTIRPSRFVR